MKRKNTKVEVGLPPGTIRFSGNQKVDKIQIHFLTFNGVQVEENTLDNHEDIDFIEPNPDRITWYDIRGLHDTELIESIGSAYQLHPLILEDIADTFQRPKFEDYDTGLFFILRALTFSVEEKRFLTEQVAIYAKPGLVLTFQETASDLFTLVRKRIQASKGRIRERGVDYLMYALIDVMVDHYFLVMDAFETVLEDVEDRLTRGNGQNIRDEIHALRKGLLSARKTLGPTREAISRFARTDSSIIEERTGLYIRDLQDHTVQVIDKMENYRDLLNGLQDLHISEISFKMNKIMQVLTIITTIFVPLSFLVGLYGMNFVNIPELTNPNGYFNLLFVMIGLVLLSLVWFKSKRWL
ncbi:MAG: magnesium/cobalt transporter CorA [Bacteroidota bacterium]